MCLDLLPSGAYVLYQRGYLSSMRCDVALRPGRAGLCVTADMGQICIASVFLPAGFQHTFTGCSRAAAFLRSGLTAQLETRAQARLHVKIYGNKFESCQVHHDGS
jgi:hypothetical protein